MIERIEGLDAKLKELWPVKHLKGEVTEDGQIRLISARAHEGIATGIAIGAGQVRAVVRSVKPFLEGSVDLVWIAVHVGPVRTHPGERRILCGGRAEEGSRMTTHDSRKAPV